MAKDRDSTEKRDKKEKKKHKHSDENGVTKHKSKKDKSRRSQVDDGDATAALLNTLEEQKPGSVKVDEDGGVVIDVKDENEDGHHKPVVIKKELLVGALVPFAHPLADDKTMRKVLRGIKRSAKHKALKRGVKEVVKALRKSPAPQTAGSSTATAGTHATPSAVVVLAADISPADVISHIPVLCEDHSVPYVFVPSRAELGAACATKRPTSVVMVTPRGATRAKKESEGEAKEEDWDEIYADLARAVEKAAHSLRV